MPVTVTYKNCLSRSILGRDGSQALDLAHSHCRTLPSPGYLPHPAVCSRANLYPGFPITSPTANPFQNQEVPHCIDNDQNYRNLRDETQSLLF